MRRFFPCGATLASLALALGLAASVPGLAQPAATTTPSTTPAVAPPAPPPAATAAPPPAVPQASAAVSTQRAKLDSVRITLDELEVSIARRAGDDLALQKLRGEIDPLAENARAVAGELGPRAEALRLRLKELGPKPDEKGAAETPDVAREREEKQAQLNEVDETVRLARALLVQAEQIDKEIADKRRELFTKRLFEASGSLLSPELWYTVGRSLPQEAAAVKQVAANTSERMVDQLTREGAAIFLGALILAIVLILPVRRFSLGLVKRHRMAGQPSRLQLARAAAMMAFFSFVGPALAAFILFRIVNGLDLFPQRLLPVVATLMGGVAFVSFVRGLAEGLLAPERMNWRLFDISDDRAAKLLRLATTVAVLLVASRTLEALYGAIAANLRLTVATKGLFAVAVALVIAQGLNLIRSVDSCDEEAFGPHVSSKPDLTGPIRTVGWALISVVIGSAVLGYVAFASFLADQIAWAGILLPTLILLLMLTDETVTASFSAKGRSARVISATVGLSRQAQDQIGVLISGAARLVLIVIAVMMLLAPWGVESGDIFSGLRNGIFGVTVGGVTLSIGTVFMAVALFLGGIVLTRVLQGWLQRRYLPHTHLDAGLKNSITTGFGYLGVMITAAMSLSYVGIGLDRITIVAGALSVGIGFGLQSIINNFVSGLILLAERGIRVGDVVEVGSEQGTVKKITVRATQIETFDRATLIVPNSNLVLNPVKNWVHSDRVSRVVIPIPLPRDTDADAVATMLREIAQNHPDVLEDPAPRVLFKKINDSSLSFELICFVGDVDVSARVSSDLTFAAFRNMRSRKIIAPAGPPTMEIAGMVELKQQVQALTDAMAAREAPPSRPTAVKKGSTA